MERKKSGLGSKQVKICKHRQTLRVAFFAKNIINHYNPIRR